MCAFEVTTSELAYRRPARFDLRDSLSNFMGWREVGARRITSTACQGRPNDSGIDRAGPALGKTGEPPRQLLVNAARSRA